MSEIEWADPPSRGGKLMTRREQSEFARQLKSRPGDWAIYPSHGSGVAIRALASRISHGRQSAFGDGFEAVSRNGVLYARFVGDHACPECSPEPLSAWGEAELRAEEEYEAVRRKGGSK
jgi:hypothetical protein